MFMYFSTRSFEAFRNTKTTLRFFFLKNQMNQMNDLLTQETVYFNEDSVDL